MCSGNNSHVHLVSPVAAKPLEFLLLQDPQQFRLQLQRDVAHFIQEERALIR